MLGGGVRNEDEVLFTKGLACRPSTKSNSWNPPGVLACWSTDEASLFAGVVGSVSVAFGCSSFMIDEANCVLVQCAMQRKKYRYLAFE
jgi:hypothetical protein